MTTRNVLGMRRVASGLGIVIAASAAGCAADTDEPSNVNGAVERSPADTVASANEAARVQSFLDSQYRREDVVHSFTSKLGAAIDCVDFAAEPGVRRMLARGATLEELQRPAEMPEAVRLSQTAPMNDAYFQGDPDESGRARACPEGSTPHARIAPELIARAGGLDAYLGAMKHAPRKKSGPVVAPPDAAGPQYAHIEPGWTSLSNTWMGGMATLAVAAPTVPQGSLDHSLAQLWVTAGLNPSLQTVEAGWIVDPGWLQSNAPYLFIYATADSYVHGCYNNVDQGYGCITWVPSGATLTPGTPLTAVSTRGGAQHDISVSVSHDRTCKSLTCPWQGWRVWVSVDGGPSSNLGYYAQSDFNAAGLGSGNSSFTLGSEVYDQAENFPSPPNVQMGEGPIGTGGYGQAAYMRNYGYYDSSGTLQRAGFSTPNPSEPDYAVNLTAAAGGTGFGWTNWYYYGDKQ